MEGDSSEESSDQSESWISWYCSRRGNEFFVEIDEKYIQDDFNLTRLDSEVPNYEYALESILDKEPSDPLTKEQRKIVQSSAEMLYGLIHARFILTTKGLSMMGEKFKATEFGRCPRVYCQGQPAIPVGQADTPRTNTVKLFCPRCQDIYYPRYSRHCNIDGAYFGTTFPHLLLNTFSEFVPKSSERVYVPRIYGYKIHNSVREKAQETNSKKALKQSSKQ